MGAFTFGEKGSNFRFYAFHPVRIDKDFAPALPAGSERKGAVIAKKMITDAAPWRRRIAVIAACPNNSFRRASKVLSS